MANYISGDSHEDGGPWAKDVLGAEMGNYCTPETEEFLADQHERKTGQPLRRSWEIDDPENEVRGAQTWEERKARFEEAPVAAAQSVGDPARMQFEIKRLERTYGRPMPDGLTEEQKAHWEGRWGQINQLRQAAGMASVDYSKVRPQRVSEKVLEKFAEFEKFGEGDRVGICAEAKDMNFLRLVTTRDASEKVRDAAEKRLAILSIRVR